MKSDTKELNPIFHTKNVKTCHRESQSRKMRKSPGFFPLHYEL